MTTTNTIRTTGELIVYKDVMFLKTGNTLVAFTDQEQTALASILSALWAS